ncbi:MAG TPA: pirin family protein [Dongiaceae bacterium]|nr:pirin family protein [Dongiaceae bacterium]
MGQAAFGILHLTALCWSELVPELVIDPRNADLGGGFAVKRILPFRQRRMVGPFIFLDHAGPLTLPSERLRAADVRPHPHIGLSTVSYLFAGAITHRDSLGVEQVIEPGAVNWMTAGRGIAHSERFDAPGSSTPGFEMIQSWVALPDRDEECAPAFDHYAAEQLPESEENGVWTRLIAGTAFGLASPVRTHSPLFYLHVVLQAGARIDLPRDCPERAAYIAHGTVEVDGRPYTAGQMIVFGREEQAVISANGTATVMLLGGEPLGERFIWWNFVSSRKERIEQAKADWKAGRIALPPNDNREFIPLPQDRAKPVPPEPIS